MRTALGGVLIAGLIGAAGMAEARPLRVLSLDQCADQFVLALAPDAELALSTRADDPDSWMRGAAEGRLRVRPTLEAAVGFKPDVVVRYWGGEPRLLNRLEQGGAQVLTVQDAADFEAIRGNVRTLAEGLGAVSRGETLIARMDATLASQPSKSSRGGALYLTPGGFTAGAGTTIDAILRAAGFSNLAPSAGFAPFSVERVALEPHARFILGFFDALRADWRGPGRHPVVRRAARGRTVASLPAAMLTCPGWFAADAVAALSNTR